MKIAIISDSFYPRWDGISRFLSDIIPTFSEKFELTIVAPAFKGIKPYFPKVSMELFPTMNLSVADYNIPKLQKKVIRKLISEQDCIFVQTIGILGNYAIKYAKKRNIKIVAFIHSVEWELYSKGFSRSYLLKKAISSFTKIHARNNYQKCDLLISPSIETKKVIRNIGIDTPIKVIHLGTNVSQFKPPKSKIKAKEAIGINPKSIVIGYIGRIGKEKDLPTLIKAFGILLDKYPDAMLTIIGEGSKKEEAKIIGKSIKRIGKVDNVIPYLQAMDIYVLPSLTETSSLSTMEAMTTGVPVVTTAVGHLKKYIIDKKNGMFFSEKDSEHLAENLKILISSKSLRKELGKNGRKTILKDYKIKKTIDSLVKVFMDLKK